MAVKILIYRKVRAGKEKELSEKLRDLRSKALHARGYISGETLRSIEDPSIHLVISTWKSLEDWNNWFSTPQRKALQETIDPILDEQPKIMAYEHEILPGSVSETFSRFEFSVENQ